MSLEATTPAAPAAPAPVLEQGRKGDIHEQFKAIKAAEEAKEGKTPAPAAEAAKPAEPAQKKENEGKADPSSWKSFRNEQRAWREKTKAYEAEIAKREAALVEKSKAAIAPEKLREMVESADFDGIAKIVGLKDWGDLTNQAVRAFANPEFKRIRKLEADLEERRAAETKAKKDAEDRAEREAQEKQHAEFKSGIGASLKESADEATKKIASDSDEGAMFVEAVFGRMADRYHSTGEEITPDEAAAEVIRDVIRPRLERWLKILGAPQTVTEEAAQAAAASRAAVTPQKTSKHVTRYAAKQAGPNGGKLSREEWIAAGVEALKKDQQTNSAA